MAGKPRGTETVRDMVLSLAVVLLVVGVLVAITPRRSFESVKVIDYTEQLSAARAEAPYAVVAPQGLSDRWRATSVRFRTAADGEIATWHLGFVTPRDDFAGVEQSNGNPKGFVRAATNGGRPDGSMVVAGQPWDKRYRDAKDERSLVRTIAGVTVVVTGTASYDELAQLAAALRAERA